MRSAAARLLAALLTTLPAAAGAAPAVVRVFEAPAREAPDPAAKVLHVFAEGAQVSVSETAENGWRKIRLPDGGTAFVADEAIALGAAKASPAGPAAAAAALPTAPPAPPDLRPRIYVKDLDHLAELVKEDPVVWPKAKELADQRTRAITTMAVGGGAGLVLMVAGLLKYGADTSNDVSSPNFMNPRTKVGPTLMITGLVFAIGSPLVGLALHPKRDDLLDVVNDWNTRHVDRPFELGAYGSAQSR